MPFGQLHYQEKLGNSNWTLAEAGCFVTADANLLEKLGIEVDPATLDKFYLDHGVFLYDMTDKANEDLSWWSITKYRPQLTVKQVAYSGFPDSDLAEVEFRYRSHTGETLTHFCTVHSVADRSIIDSWDGLVKSPAQYEPIYGQPIAWATFISNAPTTESPTPSAPASAPAAQHTVTVQPGWGLSNIAQAAGYADAGTEARWAAIAALNGSNDWQSFNANLKPGQKVIVDQAAPTAVPVPSAPKQLHLPASISVWHVYKPGGPYTLPYAIETLDPMRYGGLTYDILGSPATNIYLIQTQMFGEVAIYAGPDTPAQFIDGGHGEGESIPVTEVVPAPAPDGGEIPATGFPLVSEQVPIKEKISVPVATEPAADPGVTYVRFDQPMKLVTKSGAQSVNFISGSTVETFSEGTPFTAIGKATLPNGDVYFMDDNNFGIADETQRTPITVGIKTIDLSPAPEAVPAVTLSESPETVHFTAPAAASVEPSEMPALPELPWQHSMKLNMNPIAYIVKGNPGETVKIADFATGDELEVKAGARVLVGGKFLFGGAYYYRAQSSIEKQTWYGFPVTLLIKEDAHNIPFDTHDDINQLGDEAIALSKTKHVTIKAGATAQGLLSRFHKN